jgi:hypothetical protein
MPVSYDTIEQAEEELRADKSPLWMLTNSSRIEHLSLVHRQEISKQDASLPRPVRACCPDQRERSHNSPEVALRAFQH